MHFNQGVSLVPSPCSEWWTGAGLEMIFLTLLIVPAENKNVDTLQSVPGQWLALHTVWKWSPRWLPPAHDWRSPPPPPHTHDPQCSAEPPLVASRRGDTILPWVSSQWGIYYTLVPASVLVPRTHHHPLLPPYSRDYRSSTAHAQ